MAAVKRDFNVSQGATFRRKLRFKVNGVPVDITGWIFSGQLRKTVSDPSIAASISFTILNQTTNTGQVELHISKTAMASLRLKSQNVKNRVSEAFPYDIEVEFPGGDKDRVYEGVFNVSPEVTRV